LIFDSRLPDFPTSRLPISHFDCPLSVSPTHPKDFDYKNNMSCTIP
jgi:hypothetical protein